MPRLVAVVAIVLAAAGLLPPGLAQAEACKEDPSGPPLGSQLALASSGESWLAGSSLAAHASFAGLPLTSAALGPLSVSAGDEDPSLLDAAPELAGAASAAPPGADLVAAVSEDLGLRDPEPNDPEADGTLAAPDADPSPSPATPAPMCAGESDDPRCQPRAPGPGDGVEIAKPLLRSTAPPQPDLPPAGSVAVERLATQDRPHVGARSRVERPPRRG